MSHPRIEEVSDDELVDDPDEMDVEQFDFARPQKGTLQSTSAAQDGAADSSISPEALQALLGSSQPPSQPPSGFSPADRERLQRQQQEASRSFQCLYPVYFDATRSREEGRRVSKAQAVQNPLAREIAEALQHIGGTLGVPFQVVLEPAKTHPKDWANPGRVKVLIKKEGRTVNSKVKNKAHLYRMIADYLRAHPTTQEMPLRLRIHGLPLPKDGKVPTPAIPRGSKMGTILPLHSPALSGGGVSDNFLKDMMAEMGGQLPPGMANMASMMGGGGGSGSSEPKKVKEKKKK